MSKLRLWTSAFGVLLVATSLSADMFSMGSENIGKNLRNQNNDVAKFNGKQYCSFFKVGYNETKEVTAEGLAPAYFKDHQEWLPYKNDWMRGCISGL